MSIKRMHFSVKNIAVALLLAAAAHGAQAEPQIPALGLDYETNMSEPEVPVKAAAPITAHMTSIKNALEKHGFTTELVRNNQAVRITIPCADLFMPNDTVLKKEATTKLNSLASILRNPTMYKIIVAVHADDTGDDIYSDYITELRANAIDDFLLNLAANPNANVIPYGMGKGTPIKPNTSITNRALNRRVEIFILPEWNMVKDAKRGVLK